MATPYARATVAETLALATALETEGLSQRQQGVAMEVPRSTLRDWQQRQERIEADPAWGAFFTSPAGAACLHRLVVALHFVLELVGAGGIRLVGLVLELSLLDRFVAPSYGAQHGVAQAVEAVVVSLGQEEGQRLGATMPARQITVCEDETFHPAPCLVAIEPVSDFLLVEQYAPDYTADTWTKAVQEAVGDWPVEIVQATADAGRAVAHHIREDLGVHHSPALFHLQQEGVRATGAALASGTQQAEQALEAAEEQVAAVQADQAHSLAGPRSPGRPPDFARRLQGAQVRVIQARQALATARQHQEQAHQARQGINRAYHPYDLDTLATIAQQANLSDRCRQKVNKLRRHLSAMTATITFFFGMLQAKVEALDLTPEVEAAVSLGLIPAYYLAEVARKAPTADQRQHLRQTAQHLQESWQARAGPAQHLTAEERALIEVVAQECAHLFQRSSSGVEGRNGQLAWRHHHLHQIRPRKLKALTVVHNYFIRRSDGTTAAQRFFGTPPRPLFDWVLERVALPGWPAQKRATPHVTNPLTWN